MLTKRQVFKVAFLLRCAEMGLTTEETHQVVKMARAYTREKQAAVGVGAASPGLWAAALANIPGLQTLASGTSGLVSGLASGAARFGVGASAAGLVGLPLLIGGAGGLAAAKAQDLNDRDPDEIKAEERKDALRRAALRARMQTASRKRRERKRPSRPLL